MCGLRTGAALLIGRVLRFALDADGPAAIDGVVGDGGTPDQKLMRAFRTKRRITIRSMPATQRPTEMAATKGSRPLL